MVEQNTVNVEAVGSSPTFPATQWVIGPMVRIRDCLSCGRGSIPLLPAKHNTLNPLMRLIKCDSSNKRR